MGWFLYYDCTVRPVRVDIDGDEEKWVFTHTGRSSGCPTNYADLVIDNTQTSELQINHRETSGTNLSFWIEGQSVMIGTNVPVSEKTNYRDENKDIFPFAANPNCGLLGLFADIDVQRYIVFTSDNFIRLHGSNITLKIAVKSKYEGYTASWPENSTVSIEQDFTKINIAISNPATLSPNFSEADYTTTYTYNIYKAVDGVRTTLGTLNSLSGSFDLDSSDYEHLVFIFVTCTIHFGRAGTATTAAELDDGIWIDTPEIGWSPGATLLFSTNDPDIYNPASTYAVGDKVRYLGQVYECTTAIATPENWNAAHWNSVSFTMQATISVQGNAVLTGGNGTPLYKLRNATGAVDISSYTTAKTWTFDLAQPNLKVTYEVTASITKYGVTYVTSTALVVVSDLNPPAAAYWDGNNWIPCDAFYWDGQGWIPCDVFYWNGNDWIPCEG